MKNMSDKNKTKKIRNKFMMTDSTMISGGTLISNTFNEFFQNIAPNLAKKISNQNISSLHFMNDPLAGVLETSAYQDFLASTPLPDRDQVYGLANKAMQQVQTQFNEKQLQWIDS